MPRSCGIGVISLTLIQALRNLSRNSDLLGDHEAIVAGYDFSVLAGVRFMARRIQKQDRVGANCFAVC